MKHHRRPPAPSPTRETARRILRAMTAAEIVAIAARIGDGRRDDTHPAARGRRCTTTDAALYIAGAVHGDPGAARLFAAIERTEPPATPPAGD